MSPVKPSTKSSSRQRDTRALFKPGSRAETAFDNKLAALEAGDLVRAWRKTAPGGELTQVDLAERLGITQARVSAIESARGAEGPSYATLKKIALACGHAWPGAMIRAGREAEEIEPMLSDVRKNKSTERTNIVRSSKLNRKVRSLFNLIREKNIPTSYESELFKEIEKAEKILRGIHPSGKKSSSRRMSISRTAHYRAAKQNES